MRHANIQTIVQNVIRVTQNSHCPTKLNRNFNQNTPLQEYSTPATIQLKKAHT